MGLMDKFKNLFTDEEIIEEEELEEPIEIKEVKKEDEVQKLPTFMRKKIEKEEAQKKEIADLDVKLDNKKELNLESGMVASDSVAVDSIHPVKLEEKNSFKFPLDLSDNDFIEKRSRQSIHHPKAIEASSLEEPSRVMGRKNVAEAKVKSEPKVADLYKDKAPEKKVTPEKKFRATPIISPIYGVLDKNYTPDDMKKTDGENFEEKRHSKNVDFDSVRKKAYGSLTEEIKENLMCENCEYLKEAKECKEKVKKATSSRVAYSKERDNYRDSGFSCDNLVYDVLENEDTKKGITLDEATENYYDYGVAYEKERDTDEVLEPKEEVKIVHHDEEEVHKKKEIPPVKSSINLLSTLKKSMGEDVNVSKKKEENLELTDDLFNLIDSMYDERNETK